MIQPLSPTPTAPLFVGGAYPGPAWAAWWREVQAVLTEVQRATMTQPSVLVASQYLTATTATYYTAPIGPANAGSGGSTPVVAAVWIDQGTVINTDTVDRTVTLYLVPSGGSADNTNILVSAATLRAGIPYRLPEMEGKVLTAGMTIQGKASVASKVTLAVSGEVVT